MFKHKHVTRTRPTVELDNGKLRKIYVVDTDISITETDPDFDRKAYDELVLALTSYLAAHSEYEAIRIEGPAAIFPLPKDEAAT